MTAAKRILIGVTVVFALAIVSLAIALSYNGPCPAPRSLARDTQPAMKAVMQRCYGSPATLTLEEVARPTPAANELLVRVHAAAVNPLDWHSVAGSPYLMRLSMGTGTPDDPRTGADFAGTVEAVGQQVTRFKVGDRVFGGKAGAFAEYIIVREDRGIAAIPSNVSFEDAAAIPVAGVTALQALRDHGHIQLQFQWLDPELHRRCANANNRFQWHPCCDCGERWRCPAYVNLHSAGDSRLRCRRLQRRRPRRHLVAA